MGLKACHDEQMYRIELSCYHIISIPQGVWSPLEGNIVSYDLEKLTYGRCKFYSFFSRIGASLYCIGIIQFEKVFHEGKMVNSIINTKLLFRYWPTRRPQQIFKPNFFQYLYFPPSHLPSNQPTVLPSTQLVISYFPLQPKFQSIQTYWELACSSCNRSYPNSSFIRVFAFASTELCELIYLAKRNQSSWKSEP